MLIGDNGADAAVRLENLVTAKRTLVAQLCIVAACVAAIAQLVVNFPFPGPLVRPFLPPRQRWPEAEVKAWVEAQNFAPGFLEYFARDPERRIPPGNNFVSPADGLIQQITNQNGVTDFVVGLSFWDVHVVRSPVAGTVRSIESEGLYFDRNPSPRRVEEMPFLRGKDAPVQQIVSLDTKYGEIRVRLITSYWASRLKVWVHPGENLEKGQRIGRILLGSTVVAEFPGNVKGFSVHRGDRVTGGESVIRTGDEVQP